MCVPHEGSAGMSVQVTQQSHPPPPVNEQFAQLSSYYYGIPILLTQPHLQGELWGWILTMLL